MPLSAFDPPTTAQYKGRSLKKTVNWSEDEWAQWGWHQRHRIRTIDQLDQWIELSPDERKAFHKTASLFHVGITPYYASLMDPFDPKCPIRLQAVPQLQELEISPWDLEDPLGEESDMVVPGLTHRYPDRVLFYTNHNCAMYCRFCTRKRKVSDPASMTNKRSYQKIYDYIQQHPEVHDVVISGGDPLSLADKRLAEIFEELSKIPHIKYCRIGSRNLVTLPQRITDDFAYLLKSYQSRQLSIYFNTHFNHPKECSDEAWDACDRVALSGTPINNQMVLMKDVNDTVDTVRQLNRRLLQMRVQPYYIHQCDLALGVSHFRTSLKTGLEIIRGLHGHMSGMAVPQLVVDTPGGGGKVPISPNYVIDLDGESIVLRNFRGQAYRYPETELTFSEITPEAMLGQAKNPIMD
jgi:lysine 2,3-aminomutase